MSTRFLQLLLYLAVAAFLAFGTVFVGQWAVREHAMVHGRAELQAAAGRVQARAELLIDKSLKVLGQLYRSGHTRCTTSDRYAFLKASASSRVTRRVGILNADGFPVCSAPDAAARGVRLLPALTATTPIVSIGAVAGREADGGDIVIGWRTGRQSRIFSHIEADDVIADFGPAYLRSHRHVALQIGEANQWIEISGPRHEVDDHKAEVRIEAASERYPIAVRVTVPASTLMSLSEPLVLILRVGGGLAFALMVFLLPYHTRNWAPDDPLSRAIGNSEFTPYYQPIIDIRTGRLMGCEMLCRWTRPDGTVVAPDRFVEHAENSGHMFEITRQLMRKTVEEVGPLYADNPQLSMAVNLFAEHFLDRSIIDDMVEIYGDGPIGLDQIVFEVTERQPLTDLDTARKVIAEIRALGARVALDDVGTGHGGLAHLQTLGIDVLKIDKAFVDPLGYDRSATAIVESLIELASGLDIAVIAEGVETKEQIEDLRSLGVYAMQGYVFAPPLPANLYIQLAEAAAGGLSGKGAQEADIDPGALAAGSAA